MNKIITFHSAFTDSFRRNKKNCFEKFEFSTTFFHICINADDVEMIEFKTSIIFKSFKLKIAVFVAKSAKNFIDIIAPMKFKKTVSSKKFFIFGF